MVETIILIIFCHLIGDYVLQSDFLAKTKGANWYHMLVHCALYTIPFYICFGLDGRILALFLTHILCDSLKARYGKISYPVDQMTHYLVALLLYIL